MESAEAQVILRRYETLCQEEQKVEELKEHFEKLP